MLIPILVGAGVVTAVAAALQHKSPAAAPHAPTGAPVLKPPSSPDAPPPPPSAAQLIQAKLEPAMSEPLQVAVTRAVLESADAPRLQELADALEPVHPVAAAVVAARSQQIAAAPPPPPPSQGEPGARIYTVVAGDNPTKIGQKLAGRADAGLVRELAASNPTIAARINAGQLKVGEKLKIPSSWIGTPVPSDTPLVTSKTYGVVAGDNPAKIAKKLSGSSTAARIAELAAANGSKADRIKAGKLTPYNAKTGTGDLLVIPEAWRKK